MVRVPRLLCPIEYPLRSARGGRDGEADVLALDSSQNLTHLECSTDADSWAQRRIRFRAKFEGAAPHYGELLGFEPRSVTQIAVVGFSRTVVELAEGIVHKPVPVLVEDIQRVLRTKDPMQAAVPESMPLLRAMQYAAWYGGDATDRLPCECGCGGTPRGRASRFLPGHDARVERPSNGATSVAALGEDR